VLEPQIIRPGEANVLRTANQLDGGAALLDYPTRIVGGSVINDNDLELQGNDDLLAINVWKEPGLRPGLSVRCS
jgi:hypothetical protein